MRTNPDIEIDAEFSEPEPFEPKSDFDRILELLNTLDAAWRDSKLVVLADAAAQMSCTMRQWMQENNQSVPEKKPIDFPKIVGTYQAKQQLASKLLFIAGEVFTKRFVEEFDLVEDGELPPELATEIDKLLCLFHDYREGSSGNFTEGEIMQWLAQELQQNKDEG